MSEQQGHPEHECFTCWQKISEKDLVWVWDECDLNDEECIAVPSPAHAGCVNEDDVIHAGYLHFCTICGDPVFGEDDEDHMKCLMDRSEYGTSDRPHDNHFTVEDGLAGYFCEGGPIGG